jgi:hypothetical protein
VLPITDERMTRFMISLEQGVELVWHAFDDMEGGEIYVKKIPSMKVTELASAVAPEPGSNRRSPGRKAARADDQPGRSFYTYEYPEHYKILPAIHNWDTTTERIKDGKKVVEGFEYSSDNNPEWMSVADCAPGSPPTSTRSETSEHDPLRPPGHHPEDIAAVEAVLHSDFLTQGRPSRASSRRWRPTAARPGWPCATPPRPCTSPAWPSASAPATACGPAPTPSSPRPTAGLLRRRGRFRRHRPAHLQHVGRGPQAVQAAASNSLPKVVIPVHFAGQSCDMRAIRPRPALRLSHHRGRLPRRRRRYLGEPVGNCRYSDITIFSFHPVKIITTGEGGMAMTNDPALADHMERLRSHGITVIRR